MKKLTQAQMRALYEGFKYGEILQGVNATFGCAQSLVRRGLVYRPTSGWRFGLRWFLTPEGEELAKQISKDENNVRRIA